MGKLREFTFVSNVRGFAESGALVVRVAGNIQTPTQLFELFYQSLTLPGYFGFNWNALFDCLRDLHWVNQRKVIIVHDDLPSLPPSEMKIYLEVLRDSILDWKPAEPHCLEAIFDESDRINIEAVITEG